MVRVLSMAQGDLTVTFGGLPYSPLTVTLSRLFEAGTGLGFLLGLGLGLALGATDVGADAEVAGADGEAEGVPGSSCPHAPRRSDAKSPRMIAALAGNERTGKPYPPYAWRRVEVRPLLDDVRSPCRR